MVPIFNSNWNTRLLILQLYGRIENLRDFLSGVKWMKFARFMNNILSTDIINTYGRVYTV